MYGIKNLHTTILISVLATLHILTDVNCRLNQKKSIDIMPQFLSRLELRKNYIFLIDNNNIAYLKINDLKILIEEMTDFRLNMLGAS